MVYIPTYMTDDLVQRLRTCSTQERRAVAMELARTRNYQAVKEFIRMVEGKRKCGLIWYGYGDVLIGIEALGETNNKDALAYLHSVNESYTKTHTHCVPSSHAKDAVHSEIDFEEVHITEIKYPHARGKLKKILEDNFVPPNFKKGCEVKLGIKNAIAKLEFTVK